MAIAIDTLVYVRRLRESGVSEKQAEAHAEALAAAMTDSLATKQDLRELEARLDTRFAQVDTRFAQVDARFAQVDARFMRIDARFEYLEKHLDTRLAEQEKRLEIRFAEQTARFNGTLADLERRMTMRLGGIMVGGIGVFSALVKFL
jgi:chromosome segregation ATPase